jgi:hypothetical protein
VVPTLGVIAHCVVGQAPVDEADPRLVAIGNQGGRFRGSNWWSPVR